MSKFSPSGISGIANSPTPISISGAVNPNILNVSMAVAGTEYSSTLPVDTVRFIIRLQESVANTQLAYVVGTAGSIYIKINRGCIYGESELTLSSALNLYFQADKPSQVAEIVYWTT